MAASNAEPAKAVGIAIEAPPAQAKGSNDSKFGPPAGSMLAGFLLWTTFPTIGWGWLAWIALVPLFLLVKSERSGRTVYLSAWAGGLTFWTLAVQWVRLTDSMAWVAWLAMAVALSLFWPLNLAIIRLSVRTLKLPLMIAAPFVWVADEYVRAYFVTGFPWYYLAHSQTDAIAMIQVADLTGSLGISFLIVIINAWIVELLTTPLLRPTPRGSRLTLPQTLRLATVLGSLIFVVGYGWIRTATAEFRPGPRVALLQSNLIQRYKEGKGANELHRLYRTIVQRATAAAAKPDLIVWPETAYPFSYIAIDPKTSADDLDLQVKRAIGPDWTADRWRLRAKDIVTDLHTWTDQIGIPMLVGSLTYDHRPLGLSKYNSAILFQPTRADSSSYHKLHLVPFGEYVPLIEVMPWLTVFTPYHGSTYIPSLSFGREPTVLDLGPYRLATAICFEDTVPHVVRRFFDGSDPKGDPDLLLNLSNDGWFQDSAEHDMHLAISIYRAIENRVPLARSVNTGISAIVDGNGKVIESLGKMKEGIVSGVVPLDDRRSLYSRWGDWLGRSSLAVTIGFVVLGAYRRRNVRRSLGT